MKASTKELFEVEIKLSVYVYEYSAGSAERLVQENLSTAIQQAGEHAKLEVYSPKLEHIPPERVWDRPLGSDRKQVKELLVT